MGKTTAGERETVLRLSGITKRFGPLLANDDISLLAEWRARRLRDHA